MKLCHFFNGGFIINPQKKISKYSFFFEMLVDEINLIGWWLSLLQSVVGFF